MWTKTVAFQPRRHKIRAGEDLNAERHRRGAWRRTSWPITANDATISGPTDPLRYGRWWVFSMISGGIRPIRKGGPPPRPFEQFPAGCDRATACLEDRLRESRQSRRG